MDAAIIWDLPLLTSLSSDSFAPKIKTHLHDLGPIHQLQKVRKPIIVDELWSSKKLGSRSSFAHGQCLIGTLPAYNGTDSWVCMCTENYLMTLMMTTLTLSLQNSVFWQHMTTSKQQIGKRQHSIEKHIWPEKWVPSSTCMFYSRLVLILAGAVCNLFFETWYFSVL